jgi:hypothetical protein
MKGQELKIKFIDDLAFLTKEIGLDFNQVEISTSPVRFKAPAFWTVRVINFIENENRLFVEVLSYQVGETEFPTNQIELADTLLSVVKVTFKSIDTGGLLRTLNSNKPLYILPPKSEKVYRLETPIQPQSEIIYNREEPIQPEIKIQKEPIKHTYKQSFSIPIKDVLFLSGKVAFEKKIQELGKLIHFEIANENIIKEYDAIKNYFASVLKTKKIVVDSTIITIDGMINSINSSSYEINKIDKTFIEEIKSELVRMARRSDLSGDKQLFTMEEYLEAFDGDSFKTQHLFKNEDDFFEKILEKSETKHYRHLRFLSSRHKADIQKLRFVHKPFSFLFLLSGIDSFYIIWETLDTQEATYIWAIDKEEENLNQVLVQAEKTINLIIKDGKNEYINRKEINFNRVFHDYTDFQNGFKNWKDEIEQIVK